LIPLFSQVHSCRCSIGIEQALAEIIQCGTTTEDEVVAVLDLREEQPVLAACMLSLSCGEERREVRQPLLAADHQIARSERVGEFLQATGICAFQECIGGLLESDAFLAHPVRQPMVLVEGRYGRRMEGRGRCARNIRPQFPVVDVKIVLNDPALPRTGGAIGSRPYRRWQS